jgi:hypothetical protein
VFAALLGWQTRSRPAAAGVSENWCASGTRLSPRSSAWSLGEVAAVACLPFVVGFDQDGAGEPEEGVGVGEEADDAAATTDRKSAIGKVG